MTRVRALLIAMSATVAMSLVSTAPANAIKAREAIDRANDTCTVDFFTDNGRPTVMIICGTFPFHDVIFCKGDDECYVSHAPVQTPPTTRKPGQGEAVVDAQQTPAEAAPASIPARFPKETALAYAKRVNFRKVTADDALVRKALAKSKTSTKAKKAN